MATGTLYTFPDNVHAQNILIAAKYSGANVKVDPSFKYGQTNKEAAFLAKFPLGKVPAFESSDGVRIFGSNAIAYFVSNTALHGATAADAALIQQWINFADNEITPASNTWVYPCLGVMQYNKQNTERAKEEVKKALSVLNSHLATRTFLVGERVSLADISVCCSLLHLYKLVLDDGFRKEYQNTNRWFVTMVNQPNVKAVLGDVKLCDKMAQFDAKKFAELQGKGGQQKKEPKEKKQEKPKQEKKKKEEKPADDDDDAEEEEAERPKKKDIFAALPKGTFVMDDWKKCYSNNDTETVALPYFWKNFDKENYSIWHGVYKYPEDLRMVFMSCNLVGGMFQRLDKLRKYGFGSVLIFGENNKSEIAGVWVVRGQQLPFDLDEDLNIDAASYEWKKLDFDSDADRKLITDYFMWQGEFKGKKVNQGKVFK